MAEALTLHMEHEQALQKSKDQLEIANRQLMAEKELNQQLVNDKIGQARTHKKLIKELQVISVNTVVFYSYSKYYLTEGIELSHMSLYYCT